MKYLPAISRSLIALLFVVMGAEKAMNYSDWVSVLTSLNIPLPTIAVAIVILIEIPVALAFAYGYRKCITGGILLIFTLIATILVHSNWSDLTNMIMALKNISIIGGLLAVIGMCDCGKCPASKK